MANSPALGRVDTHRSPTYALLTNWFEAHRTFLCGLCYRITGSTADADDIVQETFIRALEHPPEQLDDPRPWLVRVAVNAARDLLRRRKRRGEAGQGLRTPIAPAGEDHPSSYAPVIDGAQTPEGRYDLLESASLAFLQTLEALTPTQGAVLLLSDVFDYSASEVSAALGMSEGNARIVRHRARKTMASHESRRPLRIASTRARTQQVLQRFLALLGAGDVRGIERMLAGEILALTDGRGPFTATLRPIAGHADVKRFFARLTASQDGSISVAFRTRNGRPAVVLTFEPSTRGRRPTTLVLTADVSGTAEGHPLHVTVNSIRFAAVSPLALTLGR